MINKLFSSDKEYLKKLNEVILEMELKDSKSDEENLIYKKLIDLREISYGRRELIMEQKLYKGSYRWLSDLGDIANSKLGNDYLDLFDYFGEYFVIKNI